MVNKSVKFLLPVLFVFLLMVTVSSCIAVSASSTIEYSHDTFTYTATGWTSDPAASVTGGQYVTYSHVDEGSGTGYFHIIFDRAITLPNGYEGMLGLSIDYLAQRTATYNVYFSFQIIMVNSSGSYVLFDDTGTRDKSYGVSGTFTCFTPYDPDLCKLELKFLSDRQYTYTSAMNMSVDNFICNITGNLAEIESNTFSSISEGWSGGSISSGAYSTTASTATTHTLTKQLPLVGNITSGYSTSLFLEVLVSGSGSAGSSRTWHTKVQIVNSTGTFDLYDYTAAGTAYSFTEYVTVPFYYDSSGVNITVTQTASGSITSQSVSVDNFHYAMVLPSIYYNITALNEATMVKFESSGTSLYVTGIIGGTVNYYQVPASAFCSGGTGWYLLFTLYPADSVAIKVCDSNDLTTFYIRHIAVNGEPIANITFLLTNSVNMVIGITFTIYDVSNYWTASSNVTGRATQTISGTTYTIDEGQLDITQNLLMYLTYGQYYYLTLYNPSDDYTYTYGLFYSTSSTIVLVISQSPMSGTSPAEICTWNVTNADNLLNITADFGGVVSPEIKIYNESLLLEATYTFTDVEYVSISYPDDSNQSYSVKLTIPEYGWIQSRIAAANPASGFIVGFPLLASLDATTVMLAFITAISFVWTPKYKGMGAVITVGLAGLFVYLRWIAIPITVITLWFVLALIYALEHREGEDQ